MKKYILLSLMALMCLTSSAQTDSADNSYYAYCELLGTDIGFFKTKVVVSLDFGEEKKETIYGEDGKPIKFHSMPGAINYMSKRGWKVKGTYVYDEGKQHVIHFLLEKKVSNDAQIREGLVTQKVENQLTKEEMDKRRNDGDGMYY